MCVAESVPGILFDALTVAPASLAAERLRQCKTADMTACIFRVRMRVEIIERGFDGQHLYGRAIEVADP